MAQPVDLDALQELGVGVEVGGSFARFESAVEVVDGEAEQRGGVDLGDVDGDQVRGAEQYFGVDPFTARGGAAAGAVTVSVGSGLAGRGLG